MSSAFLQSLARQVLTVVGAELANHLVAHGFTKPEAHDLLGSLLVAGSIVWSWATHRKPSPVIQPVMPPPTK